MCPHYIPELPSQLMRSSLLLAPTTLLEADTSPCPGHSPAFLCLTAPASVLRSFFSTAARGVLVTPRSEHMPPLLRTSQSHPALPGPTMPHTWHQRPLFGWNSKPLDCDHPASPACCVRAALATQPTPPALHCYPLRPWVSSPIGVQTQALPSRTLSRPPCPELPCPPHTITCPDTAGPSPPHLSPFLLACHRFLEWLLGSTKAET